jgi:hypothetical protein
VNAHRLDLSIILKRIRTQLSADTRFLVSTKGSLVVGHIVLVNPDCAGLESVGDADRSVEVVGVNTSCQTVGGVVGELENFLFVLEFLDCADRSENFFLDNLHLVVDVGEDGGLNVVALVTQSLTSDDNLGTGLLALVNVSHDTVELKLRDLRALVGALLEGVADLVLFSTSLECFQELVVDGLVDEDTGSSTAALAMVKVYTKVDPRDSVLEVGVWENNIGRLSSKLESDLLQVTLGRSLQDLATDQGRTSEGNLVNIHVRGDSGTGNTTETRDNVDNTRRETSLLNKSGSVQSRERSLFSSLENNSVTSRNSGTNLP